MIRLPRLPAGSLGRSRLPGMVSGLVLAVILIQAVSVRLGGIGDRLGWNPDEVLIGHWMKMYQGGAGFDAAYPGGFFVMSRPAKAIFEKGIHRPLWKLAQRCGLTEVEYSARGMAFRQWGLIFNLLLTLASIGLVYRLGLTVAGSRPGALAGAFVFAFHPVSVEHSHYLETDVAMLFCAVLALQIMTWYMRTGQGFALALASLVCGFAFGVKYTNAALLPVLLLLVFVARFKRGRGRASSDGHSGGWSSSSLFLPKAFSWARRLPVCGILVAILLFGVGNELATPRPGSTPGRVSTPSVEAPAAASARTPLAATRFVKAANHLRGESQDLIAEEGLKARFMFVMRAFAGALAIPGVPWLLLVGAGMIALAASPRFRLFLPLTLGYPAAYVGMIAVVAPWFRAQEILPLLPSFSLSIAALVAIAVDCMKDWRSQAPRPHRASGPRRACACFALLAIPAVFVFAWKRAVDLDDVFAMPDTRESVADFLSQAFPLQEQIFLDRQMVVNVEGMTNVVKGTAWLDVPIEARLAANPDLRWFLVNGSLAGRGMIDPDTGHLRPVFQEREDAFRRRARLVRSWGLVNARPSKGNGLLIPTFRSPICELWVLDSDPDGALAEEGAKAPRDVLLRADPPVFYQGQGVTEPRSYLELDPNASRRFGLGGPGALSNGAWLVLCNPNQTDLEIKTRGYGGKTRTIVRGGATTVVRLKPRLLDAARRHVRLAHAEISLRSLSPVAAARPVRVFAAFSEVDAQQVALAQATSVAD